MKRKILSILIAIISVFSLAVFAACGESEAEIKPVKSLEMASLPTKTEYYVGEKFELAGASVKANYEDGTSEVFTLPAEGFDVSEPNLEKVGEKTVTVTLAAQRQRTSFKISVMLQGFKLTYDLNYDGAPAANSENVVKNTAAKKPADPTREGHAFYNWYNDKECTQPYDFAQPVTADKTIYASWKEDGATYFEVTYDLGYYGVAPQTYTQIVKSGEKAKVLAITPSRAEYTFNGWFKDENGSSAFNAATENISADTTVYAGWTKTKTGSSVYTFEAEQTSLKGKTGPGFSGSATEDGMIVSNGTASGGKCVSFLYKKGLTLDFNIASDVKVTDAKITVFVAAEMDGITFDSNAYQVIVNGTALSFAQVSLPNNSTFTRAIEISGVTLEQGANSIVLKTNNNTSLGGTYAGIAPMVDCIKIETSAVLIWDAVKGLPMNY